MLGAKDAQTHGWWAAGASAADLSRAGTRFPSLSDARRCERQLEPSHIVCGGDPQVLLSRIIRGHLQATDKAVSNAGQARWCA